MHASFVLNNTNTIYQSALCQMCDCEDVVPERGGTEGVGLTVKRWNRRGRFDCEEVGQKG